MSAFHNTALMGASGQQGYQISNSLRFRSSASAYLNRTFSTPTSTQKMTLSCWVKIAVTQASGILTFINGSNGAQTNAGNSYIQLRSDGTALKLIIYNNGGGLGSVGGYRTFTGYLRDYSAWYHIVLAADTTQASAANRYRGYINGVELTTYIGNDPDQNVSLSWLNTAVLHNIGKGNDGGGPNYTDAYMAEMNWIDGQQLTPSSFGQTDSLTGQWVAKKYSGTYGTNGFYLKFADTSGVTAATIGKDSSGNGNNWTPNNISNTAGVTYDFMIDSPTVGPLASNYATLNPLAKGPQFTVSDANLKTGDTTVGNYHQSIGSTIAVKTGKWYWEIASNGTIYNSRSLGIAFAGDLTTAGDNPMWNASTQLKNYRAIQLASSTTVQPCRSIAGTVTTSTNITLPVTLTGSNIFMVAMDIDAGAIWFGVDGTWLKSATTAEIIAGTTTNAVYTDIASPSDSWTPALYNYLGASTGYGWIANFGQRPFTHTPPTGFKALNTQNLPVPTIFNGAAHHAVNTYTGTNATQTINNAVNGTSFQPDLVWAKIRSSTGQHVLTDSVRGVSTQVFTSSTAAETTESTKGITAFNSNGFTVGTDLAGTGTVNSNGYTYVAWQWKAGGTTVTNTNGTISSQVSVNPTAGFSVVTYTGNGTTSATVGHGLGVAPKMIILKSRSGTSDWEVFHTGLSASNGIRLNSAASQVAVGSTSGGLMNTSPTSTTFGFIAGPVNVNNVNASAETKIAYCFAEVAGYSAFGTYVGNSSTDGPFVYTGFRPRFVLTKAIGTANGTNNSTVWTIFDTTRNTYNPTVAELYPAAITAEGTDSNGIDILSNGFKLKRNSEYANWSGTGYIYACFAENPFKYSNAR